MIINDDKCGLEKRFLHILTQLPVSFTILNGLILANFLLDSQSLIHHWSIVFAIPSFMGILISHNNKGKDWTPESCDIRWVVGLPRAPAIPLYTGRWDLLHGPFDPAPRRTLIASSLWHAIRGSSNCPCSPATALARPRPLARAAICFKFLCQHDSVIASLLHMTCYQLVQIIYASCIHMFNAIQSNQSEVNPMC